MSTIFCHDRNEKKYLKNNFSHIKKKPQNLSQL